MVNAKEEKSNRRWFLIFVIFVLIILSFVNYHQRNFEFFAYNLIILSLVLFIYFYYREIKLPNMIILGLLIMILLYFMGSDVHINGQVLWDHKFGILGYDNFVHAFDSFVLVFLSYNLLSSHMHDSIKMKSVNLTVLLILVALGLGSIWENIEFGAVTFIKNTTVGDYVNNALDLLFNLIGATIGAVSLVLYKKKKGEF